MGFTRFSLDLAQRKAEIRLRPGHSEETTMRWSCSGDYRTYLKPQPICLFLAIAGVAFSAAPPKPSLAPEQKPEFLTLPLSFEANRGQTDPTVKFLSRGDG